MRTMELESVSQTGKSGCGRVFWREALRHAGYSALVCFLFMLWIFVAVFMATKDFPTLIAISALLGGPVVSAVVVSAAIFFESAEQIGIHADEYRAGTWKLTLIPTVWKMAKIFRDIVSRRWQKD